MSNTRIQIKREDFVKAMVEVSAPPRALVEKLERPPFCHLLSTYVIRPVACDENPFIIHHKNKQPMFVSSQKKGKPARHELEDAIVRNGTTNDQDSSDDEFETVKTDKKRVKKAPLTRVINYYTPANPQFPASDPSSVKVIERNLLKKTAPLKGEEPVADQAKPESKPVE